MEFPRLVYKSASKHELAEDQDQYDELIKSGWYDSVPAAIAARKPTTTPPKVEVPDNTPPKVEVPDNTPPTRVEMEAKAKELGITIPKKTSDADLLVLIEAKLAE